MKRVRAGLQRWQALRCASGNRNIKRARIRSHGMCRSIEIGNTQRVGALDAAGDPKGEAINNDLTGCGHFRDGCSGSGHSRYGCCSSSSFPLQHILRSKLRTNECHPGATSDLDSDLGALVPIFYRWHSRHLLNEGQSNYQSRDHQNLGNSPEYGG